MISARRLRELRNDIPIERVIIDIVELPAKRSEGYLRFLCPLCSEFNGCRCRITLSENNLRQPARRG